MDAMEPNANLVEQRQLAQAIENGLMGEDLRAAAERLAELQQALDAWLMSGGYAPEAWLDKRPAGSARRGL
jgi:hypothetical protein